ncbi:unnamed protein product, partial [Ectocarpus sp. 8 AP-2014]
ALRVAAVRPRHLLRNKALRRRRVLQRGQVQPKEQGEPHGGHEGAHGVLHQCSRRRCIQGRRARWSERRRRRRRRRLRSAHTRSGRGRRTHHPLQEHRH